MKRFFGFCVLNLKKLFARQNNYNLRKLISLTIAVGFMVCTAFCVYSEKVNRDLSNNLIRLHVVANSDLPEDQEIKKEVKDAVVSYMHEKVKNFSDKEQAEYNLKNDLPQIEKIVKEVIKEKGKNYPVKATVGEYYFPTKSYGDITLPAGKYEALKIIIGNGGGENWWCVLFPPLCFVDATHGTVSESVKQKLKNSLTEEEYNIITSADSEDDIPVKIKFKIVELFQETKMKISSFLSRIF